MRVLLFVLLCIAGCTHPATPRQQVLVMSYNVEYNRGTPDATVQAIIDAGADVVFLQEVSAPWKPVLEARFGAIYPHRTYLDHLTNNPSGLAVLSKYPITSSTTIDAHSGGWFPSSIVELDTPAGSLQALHVHLRPLIDDKGSKVKGFFTVEAIHQREIEAMYPQLKADRPTLIIGDFNEGNNGAAVRWLKSKQFIDSLPLFDADTPTWHGKVFGIDAAYRDDHIFHSPDLKCTAAKVIKAGASDHYPITATIVREH